MLKVFSLSNGLLEHSAVISFTGYSNTSTPVVFFLSWLFASSWQLCHETCVHVKLRPHIVTGQRQCTILQEIKSVICGGTTLLLFIIIRLFEQLDQTTQNGH